MTKLVFRMPAYDDSPWFALFFIVYIITNTYIFINLFLAVIYNSYRTHLQVQNTRTIVYIFILKLIYKHKHLNVFDIFFLHRAVFFIAVVPVFLFFKSHKKYNILKFKLFINSDWNSCISAVEKTKIRASF